MALTPSTMVPLGSKSPDFSLLDVVSGEDLTLSSVQGTKGLLVMFICNHCPFVIHVQDEIARLGRDYQDSGIVLVAINANDVESYPEDSPEKMKERAKALGFLFPYLYDQSQSVAKAYHAECTPDFFLFDAEQKLVYRGQLDGSRPGNGVPVTGSDLRAAIEALLSGEPISIDQKPSIGCNIKWR